jgi:hypothetical protein
VSKALCGSSVAAIALIFIALATAFSFEPLTRGATNAPAVVEHGKFMLHKMEQPLGEETFETTRDGEKFSRRRSTSNLPIGVRLCRFR